MQTKFSPPSMRFPKSRSQPRSRRPLAISATPPLRSEFRAAI